MNKEIIDQVRQSYDRCLNDGAFFDKFYDRFLASSPEVRAKFSNTNFAKQKDLLNKGISMMIMYAGGDNAVANNVISRLRESHNSAHMDIPPRLYVLWKRVLMETISESDPKYTSEISEAWSQVLDVGIKDISDGYNEESKRTA